MGIFSRLGTLIKSNLNDLISKAEDPEKMLNQVLIDMQNQLVEAKKQVAVAIADEKKLRKQADDEKKKADEWERKAILAVKAGEDDLYFAVPDLEKVQARARKLGCLSKIQVHGQSAADIVTRPWGERSFYVEDPFGNGLCFVDEKTLFTGRRS